MKRVVITGMGIYSCIGKNLDEVKDSLYNGKSGIGIDPVRKELGYFSALTGILERPDLKKLLDRRKRLCLPEQGEYAYLATLEAFHLFPDAAGTELPHHRYPSPRASAHTDRMQSGCP